MTEVTQTGYQQSFMNISTKIDNCRTVEEWIDVYKLLVHWELELSSTESNMTEMLMMQKSEANNGFAKFIRTTTSTGWTPTTHSCHQGH